MVGVLNKQQLINCVDNDMNNPINFASMINHQKRYQVGLKIQHLYPKINNVCACGCGQELTGRKTKWASQECNTIAHINTAIIKGNISVIRNILFSVERGVCQICNRYDEHWQADHIHPVHWGGGACGIENYQTICTCCHYIKSAIQSVTHRAAISSHEDVRASTSRLNALGEKLYSFRNISKEIQKLSSMAFSSTPFIMYPYFNKVAAN
jgi:hypothetical protein